jgi:hypothetical protein
MKTLDEVRAASRLPPDVLDAVADLYDDERQMVWFVRYASACRRRKLTMRFLALRAAGYPPEHRE